MKLCIVGDGNSIHIQRWAEWFKKAGNEVYMLSLTPLRTNFDKYDKYAYIAKRKGFMGYARTIFPIRAKVREWQPDIVHGHYLTSAGFYASLSGCKHKVVSAWGSDIYKDTKNRLKNMCIRYAIDHSDVCIGDSDHIVKAVRGMSPDADVRKVIFGIDTELFKPNPIPHDKFTFLSIRATAPIYNPLIIVKAFEMLDMDAELWMQMPSAECQDVMDYVRSRPELKQKVRWLYSRSYDKMPELYNSVDVGISIPSWDSNSTAMMECMACGVPVIASYIEQNREMIKPKYLFNWCFTWKDENGWLVSMKSENNLTNVMKGCSTHDKEHIGRLGENARKTIVDKADWNNEMKKAEKIYHEVLKN